MRLPVLIVFLGICVPTLLFSQRNKVVLVFSGGGAKGLAHVGVLKALEANNIPIDGIVGTSMGGVVGAFYAAGYSPAQIEKIATSAAFLDWVNGRIPRELEYYFFQSNPDPSNLVLGLNLNTDTGLQATLASYLANDLGLNFMFWEKLAQSAHRAGYDFDSLYVPYRATASEVFTQELITMRSGNLSEAARATMTVPLFYRPIKIDNRFVFDGGIYNNFPVDIARQDFNPDVVIGVNVSDKNFLDYPFENDEQLLSQAVMFSIVDKSDTIMAPGDIYLQPNLGKLSALDFGKAQAFIDSGYTATLRKIGEINKKIDRRISLEERNIQRASFLNDTLPLKITDIEVSGLSAGQQSFVRRYIFRRNLEPTLSNLKAGYYRLASEEYFKRIYPSIEYIEDKEAFRFKLAVKPENLINIRLGGLTANRDIGYLFLGLDMTRLGQNLTKYQINVYTGEFYKSIHGSIKTFFPFWYLEPNITYNNWDYLDTEDFLTREKSPSILQRTDLTTGLNIGFELGKKRKLILGNHLFRNIDKYSNTDNFDAGTVLDRMRFQGYRADLIYSRSELNHRIYASGGSSYQVALSYIQGNEKYDPGTTSVIGRQTTGNHNWLQLQAFGETYATKGRYTAGVYVQGNLSAQPAFTTLYASRLYTADIYALPEYKSLFLPNYRALNFIMVGSRNIWKLNKRLDARLELYGMNKFSEFRESSYQEAEIYNTWWNPAWLGTFGFVFNSPVGPAGFRVNYFEGEKKPFQLFFHIGYILYNKSSF